MPKPRSLTSRRGLLCFPARHQAVDDADGTVAPVESDDTAPARHGGERQPAWNVLFVVCAVFTLAHAARIGQPGRLAAALLLASVPFCALLLLTGTLQTHGRRPRRARTWAVLWGALVATSASSYTHDVLGGRPDWTTIVLVAPVVEEAAKAAGILLLLRYGRMRRPLDGVIYALLVGGGFSLTENTFYFFNAISSEIAGDDGVLRDVFLMRGIVSPLAHPVFIGILAVCAAHPRTRRPPALLLAWMLGVVVHSLWNHAAVAGALGGLVAHVLALSLTLTAAAILLAVREGRAGSPDDVRLANASGSDTGTWYQPLPWYRPEDDIHPR